jgi:hypothetical protein
MQMRTLRPTPSPLQRPVLALDSCGCEHGAPTSVERVLCAGAIAGVYDVTSHAGSAIDDCRGSPRISLPSTLGIDGSTSL